MKGLLIRSSTKDDIPQICEILLNSGWESGFIEIHIAKISKGNVGEIFVAVNSNLVVGFLQIEHLEVVKLDFIHSLVVARDHRRQGIATKLMKHAELSSQAKGSRGIYLNTPSDNMESRALYKSLGYSEVCILPQFHNAQTDRITCLKLFGQKLEATFKPTDAYKILISSDQDAKWIDTRLSAFNNQQLPFTQSPSAIHFNHHIKNEAGNIIAGINAIMYLWNMVFVDSLFIEEAYRKQGLGAKLLKHVETEAKAKGAYLIFLDTFDFQAKDFYLKQGYEIFGTLDDCPKGHKRYYLRKSLN